MPPIPEPIADRLRKLKALAEQGVGGEADNAKAALLKTLAKHGLSLEDIADAQLRRYDFAFKGKDEQMILVQVMSKVLNQDRDLPLYRVRNRAKLLADLSPEQYIDVREMFDWYRAEWRDERKRMQTAFVLRHGIHPSKAASTDGPKLSPEEVRAIRDLMFAMRSETYRRTGKLTHQPT